MSITRSSLLSRWYELKLQPGESSQHKAASCSESEVRTKPVFIPALVPPENSPPHFPSSPPTPQPAFQKPLYMAAIYSLPLSYRVQLELLELKETW